MKRSTRTFLFLSFLLLFTITAPLVIAYSQGYRIDIENKTLVKTGAIFVEAGPVPIELFIDGKFRKRSNLIFQNIFAGNLIPKAHLVEVKKDGYFPWQKNLFVYPKLVTEAKNVTLFPDQNYPQVVITGVQDFFFSPSKKLIAFVEKDTTHKLSIFDIEKSDKLLIRLPKKFSEYEISKILWNRDSTRVLFSIEKGEAKRWVLIDLTDTEAEAIDISKEISMSDEFIKNVRGLNKPIIYSIEWNPDKPAELFFIVRDISENFLLFNYDLKKKEASQPLAYDVLEYAIDSSKIFYISSLLGSINSINLLTGEIAQISFHPLPDVEKGSGIDMLSYRKGQGLVIRVDNSVYVYGQESVPPEKISSYVKEFVNSSDYKKLLLLGENDLAVYWLEDVHIQPFHDAGDYAKILSQDTAIYSAVWFTKNNSYIIFSSGDSIKIIELDGRDKRNIYTIVDMAAKKLFYEDKTSTLYFLSGDAFYSLSLK